MLNQEQIHETFNFSEAMGDFINKDGVLLLMDQATDHDSIRNSFFIYDGDHNKHFLGEIAFQGNNHNYFIDYDVIFSLKEKGWL